MEFLHWQSNKQHLRKRADSFFFFALSFSPSLRTHSLSLFRYVFSILVRVFRSKYAFFSQFLFFFFFVANSKHHRKTGKISSKNLQMTVFAKWTKIVFHMKNLTENSRLFFLLLCVLFFSLFLFGEFTWCDSFFSVWVPFWVISITHFELSISNAVDAIASFIIMNITCCVFVEQQLKCMWWQSTVQN